MSEATPIPTVANLDDMVEFAQKGIVSKTVVDSEAAKIILFCFEAGQGLSEHAAPFAAAIQVLQGTGVVTLAGEPHEARPHALFFMPPNLTHAVTARENLVFLLTMIKR